MILKFVSLTLAISLAACGGGGTGADAGPNIVSSGVSLTGVAATGAALAGAAVTAKCVTGSDVSGTTSSDGSFSLSLSANQTLPCMLKVTGGAPVVTLYSFAGNEGRVNLTPLTDFVVARALGSDPVAAFDSFDSTKGATMTAGLAAAKAYVNAQINTVTGSTPSVDVLTGVFVVGDVSDHVLDVLGAAMRAARRGIPYLRAVSSVGGAFNAAFASSAGFSEGAVFTLVNVGGGGFLFRFAAGSVIGSGVYSAVTAEASSDFLTLLNSSCTTRASDGAGGFAYLNCAQGQSLPATSLLALMRLGGLPHGTGADIVSGPTSFGAGSAAVTINEGMAGVNAGDSCTVAIDAAVVPLTMSVTISGSSYFPQTISAAFGFRGTDSDSISVTSGGVVSQFSMSNSLGNKLVVRPNLGLFGDGSLTGSDAKVYATDGLSYYLCK